MGDNLTFKIDLSKKDILKENLLDAGFLFYETQYAFWRAQKESITLTLYKNGNLLIQGKDTEFIVDKLYENKILTFTYTEHYSKWLGLDEAGKGDYFGPIVVAGCLLDNQKQELLFKIGVRDSKNLSDIAINELASKIKSICKYSILSINPKRYNELYDEIKNQNKILLWLYKKTIDNILNQEKCECIIIDKFANEKLINDALSHKNIKIQQLYKAEEKDIAVAAASILARYEFIKKLNILSKNYKIKLHKGTSEDVINTAIEFVKKYGKDKLIEVSKLHFKTTKVI